MDIICTCVSKSLLSVSRECIDMSLLNYMYSKLHNQDNDQLVYKYNSYSFIIIVPDMQTFQSSSTIVSVDDNP